MKTERELFEDWVGRETGWDLYWSDAIQQYMDHQTNGAWFAWQASANREGFVLVPVEPTQKQVDAGVYAIDLVSNDKIQVVNVYKAMIEATK